MDVKNLCLFLAVPWAGLWYVIVAFLGHTHLPFGSVFWDSFSQWLELSCTCYENPLFPDNTISLFGKVAYIVVNRPLLPLSLLPQWHTISQLALLKSQQVYRFNSGQEANINGADEIAHIHNLICIYVTRMQHNVCSADVAQSISRF